MASSAKTEYLGLSQWAAGDYNERSDFNSDNKTLDTAIKDMDEDMGMVKALAEEAKEAAGQALSTADSKATPSTAVTFTLYASSWTGDGPYTQLVQIDGITANNNAIVDTAMDSTGEQEDAYAAAQIKPTAQGDGTITFTAMGDLPDVDISMGVIIVG